VPLDEYLRRAARKQLRAPAPERISAERSDEYGAHIIHALETGAPFTFNGNVMNEGLIDNLPYCCVEVPWCRRFLRDLASSRRPRCRRSWRP
jgi:alpha-galactosidase